MIDPDHWREIATALARNKLRTFLTAFGIFWGIFFLVIMLGSGSGLRNGVMRDFEGTVTNSFFVWTQATSVPYRGLPPGRRFDLRDDDVTAIRDRIPEAEVIAPRHRNRSAQVVHKDESGTFTVMGDYPEIRLFEARKMILGRFINHLDVADRRKVAVIGSRVQDLLFDKGGSPLGDHIRINGVYFKVIGTFRSLEGGNDAERQNQTIYLPFTTYQHAFNVGDAVGWLSIASVPGVPASQTEERVLALLKSRHQVAPDDDRAFGHYNLEVEYGKIEGLFAGIRLLVWMVGVGTLAAGVIGVSNIMLVIVRERTREIGIRRAIGATPWNIMSQILLEAVLLTATSGYVGLIGGMLLMDAIARRLASGQAGDVMFANPGVDLGTALRALLILMVSGVLAGVMPARRAVRVSTVEALRGT